MTFRPTYITVLISTSCMVAALAQEPVRPTEPRYAYTLSCFGSITRFDLQLQRAFPSIDLGKKTKFIQLHGDAANSVFDGCPLIGGASPVHSGLLYLLAATTGSYQSGGRHFRLLAFHLPEMTFRSAVDLPRAISEEEEEQLSVETLADNTVQVQLGDSLAWKLTGNILQTAPPTKVRLPKGATVDQKSGGFMTLQLTGYKITTAPLQGSTLSIQALQQSGDATLYRQVGGPGAIPGTVLSHAGIVTPLNPGFPTTADSVTLAPGGEAALLQEANSHSAIGLTSTGSRLALVRTSDGHTLKTWNKPEWGKFRVIAISPGGTILVGSSKGPRFLSTGMHFPDMPVRSILYGETTAPRVIFAAQ